ncbi:MAG TPA: hypothetical protein PKE07_13700 [Lacibacter sp.]|nr:hypothetical protein [Lacibacter sp.]HMO88546.1 hypothetical protein [Lacibacter sp.]
MKVAIAILSATLVCFFTHGQINPSVKPPVPSTAQAVLKPYDYTFHKLKTRFYVPPFKSGGDKDFHGNGPQIRVTCQLRISADRKQLQAVVYMQAKETRDNWTMAEGTQTIPVFICNPSQTIQAVNGTTGFAQMDITVTDNNGHNDQFFLPNGSVAITRAQNSNWEVVNGFHHASGVELVRIVGDTDGDEAGTRTGVEIFFSPVSMKLMGSPINEVQLNLTRLIETCGNNTCGSSASATVVNYYGLSNTCEQMKARLDGSANLINFIRNVSGNNIGIDPNSMRDRLNEVSRQFTLVEEPNASQMLNHITRALNQKKPVILLTGWGSKTVRDIYANGADPVSLNPNSVLHYLVVDGINLHTRVLSVIDNGKRKYLHWDYLKQIIYWRPENAVIEGSLYSNQVKPGKIIF